MPLRSCRKDERGAKHFYSVSLPVNIVYWGLVGLAIALVLVLCVLFR
jgi:hypothetical protein